MTPEQEIALAKLEDRVLTLEIQVRDLQMRAGFDLPKGDPETPEGGRD